MDIVSCSSFIVLNVCFWQNQEYLLVKSWWIFIAAYFQKMGCIFINFNLSKQTYEHFNWNKAIITLCATKNMAALHLWEKCQDKDMHHEGSTKTSPGKHTNQPKVPS